MYTVSHIRPDRTAEIVSIDRHSPSTASIKAATHLFMVTKAADAGPAREFGQALLTAYTRANTGDDPKGAELEYDGHIYRIDLSDYPPNICPCCSALVRPDDHAMAGAEDAYCLGCFTWDRNVPACLPANSAHSEDTHCAQCGDTSFLARAEELPGSPALCVECHDKAGTEQSKAGHPCIDGCPQSTNHDGLCLTQKES